MIKTERGRPRAFPPIRPTATRRGRVTAALTVGVLAGAALTVLSPRPAAAVTTSFTTVGTSTFTVPAGVSSITATVTGANGGRGGVTTGGSYATPDPVNAGQGGHGAVVTRTFAVVANDSLAITVPSGGGTAANSALSGNVRGTPGAAGSGYQPGAAGGLGASSYTLGGTAPGGSGGGGGGAGAVVRSGSPLIVAGGGGGGGGVGPTDPTGIAVGGNGGGGGANGTTPMFGGIPGGAGGVCCSTTSSAGTAGGSGTSSTSITTGTGGSSSGAGGGGGGGYAAPGGGGLGGAAGYTNAVGLLITLSTGAGGGAGGRSFAQGEGVVPPDGFNPGGNGANGSVVLTYVYDTTTAVTSSVNPSVAGQSVTFTATVTSLGAPASGTPTGTVEFFADGVSLGTATLDAAGQATVTTSTLAAGSHSITAAYAGTTDFGPSTSPPLTQTVLATGLSLTATATPTAVTAAGDTITYNLTVTNTGGVTVNGLTPADTPTPPATGATLGTCTPTSIAPGATATCTATYTATTADITAGEIIHTFTVSGTDAIAGTTVTTNPYSVAVDARPPQPGFNANLVNTTNTLTLTP